MDRAIAILKEEAQSLRKRLAAVEGSLRLLGGSSTSTTSSGPVKHGKRNLSAASRKKLSLAAKKRWAGHKAKAST